MSLELYMPKLINNNNNTEIGSSRKKWGTTMASLSSLNEVSDYENGDFNSTENIRRAFSPPPVIRRDSDVPREEQRPRRKSWHVGKFEKKRRKGIPFIGGLHLGSKESSGSTSPTGYEKHKRGSWWNAFVPDHWPRSRRSSTDFHRSTEKIPFFRGKSRSVDHGFTSPFDLDSLRSKVEGRFESVDRLSKDTDGDSRSGSKERLAEKKMQKPPPTRTITYKVEASDTLTSVAARFDTTPSELAILNRLPSRTVFPGQVIRVPEKKQVPADGENSETNSEGAEHCSISDESADTENAAGRRLSGSDNKDAETNAEDDMLDNLRIASPKPGHAERIHSPTPATVTQQKPVRTFDRFLKINVRHITDGQGVVSGVLLVTPNAVMFDPNVSDQLVIEHGPESYGVIAPMEFVVNAAIYHDIAHMRVAHTPHNLSDSGGKPEIYHASEKDRRDSLYRPKEERNDGIEHNDPLVTTQTDSLDSTTLEIQSSPGGKADSLLTKEDTFPELRSSTEEEDDNSVCSCEEERQIGNAFPKAFERDLIIPPYAKKKTNHLLKRSDEISEKEDTSHSGDERRTESPASLPPDGEDNASESAVPHLVEAEAVIKNLEERRKSSLDHHWAVPSKIRSLEGDAAPTEESTCVVESEHTDSQSGRLVKQSCHDSGIDIREDRDPSVITPLSRKTTYSDADILLADNVDFIPPKPVRQQSRNEEETGGQKKISSVSFSLEDNKDGAEQTSKPSSTSEEAEKQAETKKNKMLKRLSYPLAWMEGITGDKDDKESSLPSSAESSHPSHSSSVFSKVFSSSPINMVTDFGTGLFLTKTPSEESSNKFQFPPTSGSSSTSSTSQTNSEPTNRHQHHHHHRHHQRCATIPSSSVLSNSHKKEGFATSFSPSSLISNVGRSSVSSFIRQQHHNRSDSTKSAGPRLDYRSMVSVEDMPELFVSFDKLIPRPARSCEDPPLYLRLRMGKPKNRRIPKTTPIMSYGKKKMRPEYWFSVPRNRVDDLYKFLNIWVPHLYGDLDEETVTERGYELVNSDTELWDDEEGNGEDEKKRCRGSSDDLSELTRESWEVLSMSDELRRALYATSTNSLDFELFLPDLNGATEILTEEHRKQLCRHLPARAEGYSWSLVFTTSQHGFSLNSMYRKMSRIDSPILMVIQDTESNVFGTLTSCTLRVSDHFYGNGESLLFTFTPEFQVYNWTGENLYFIKGNNESLSIGAGDGKFGIWLDGDLYQGRTESCTTYGNDPLVPSQDFVVKTLECWAFL
ncbi:nuclear receptor coactivator 7 isoform X5 [Planococcus citri]|uniref:nuclear receptor coactivator 7 isoform X5 n=1 Tax=Planococcus citri TaxID=170843 RepID=UPI0031F8F46D